MIVATKYVDSVIHEGLEAACIWGKTDMKGNAILPQCVVKTPFGRLYIDAVGTVNKEKRWFGKVKRSADYYRGTFFYDNIRRAYAPSDKIDMMPEEIELLYFHITP